MTDTPKKKTTTRPAHRPKKQDAPLIDYNELDKVLVFGEVVPVADENGGGTAVTYPSYRDLAQRYGVSVSVIAEYSKSHDCFRRRERAKLRTQARVEEKLVERRAEAIAISKEEEIEIIDTYLKGFKGALAEGRIRYDSPADYNTMARLKEFLLGGADSRQETHGFFTLEQLQARHREMQRAMTETTPAERGEVAALSAKPGPASEPTSPEPDASGTAAPEATEPDAT
ncbi:MAG: hypothetical protein ACLQVI_04970 [Polyangiaceae bacterium]